MNNPDHPPTLEWRDLIPLTPIEKIWELTLSLPWLAASLWSYRQGHWMVGAACSFYFFLTGLRQSHNAQHYSLGLPKLAQDFVLFTLSALMLASMHAVQTTHLHHHRHCLDDEDGEGASARLPWWQAVLTGPFFFVRLNHAAWRMAPARKRRWIALEIIATIAIVCAAALPAAPLAFKCHAAAMLAGECMTAFFAVWTVHHGCGVHEPGRTQRSRCLNAISYSMFMHAEHHLFPAVPTAHLPLLARRIEAVGGQRQQEVLTLAKNTQTSFL